MLKYLSLENKLKESLFLSFIFFKISVFVFYFLNLCFCLFFFKSIFPPVEKLNFQQTTPGQFFHFCDAMDFPSFLSTVIGMPRLKQAVN